MGSGFSKMKKQARAMQDQYEKMREESKNKKVIGVSGNGLVTVTLDGERNLTEIKIKPDCVDPQDVEGLQDLIRAAFTDAAGKIDQENPDVNNMMSSLPFSL